MHVQANAGADTPATDRTKPYRVAELAALYDVDETTVYRAIKSGQLKAYRIGRGRGTIRIPVASVTQFEAASLAAAAAVAEVA